MTARSSGLSSSALRNLPTTPIEVVNDINRFYPQVAGPLQNITLIKAQGDAQFLASFPVSSTFILKFSPLSHFKHFYAQVLASFPVSSTFVLQFSPVSLSQALLYPCSRQFPHLKHFYAKVLTSVTVSSIFMLKFSPVFLSQVLVCSASLMSYVHLHVGQLLLPPGTMPFSFSVVVR